jgi:phosphonoacetaldehyde hydrolase
MAEQNPQGVKLVVFDWAGTLIDHGSMAPVRAIASVFEHAGMHVSEERVRAFHGLDKREHIEQLLRVPEVLRSFHAVRGRAPSSADVEALYAAYVPAQLDAIRRSSKLIHGARECVELLRDRRVAAATSTGYFREAAQLVLRYARQQELVPDFAVCADDVPAGRPAPYMIFACMQALAVTRPREVLVVGDTIHDVMAARNAGCLSAALAGSGNEVGLSSEEWEALSVRARNAALANAHRTFREVGADFVIDSLAELPLVIRHIAEHDMSSAA